MIKLLIAGRRAAGRTRQGAHDHLRDIHAKMVVFPPEDAGAMPLDYTQNHVFDGRYPETGALSVERDLVTELWFESIDHLKTATSTSYYLEHLRPDEPRFVDDTSVAKMMVRAEPLREGARGQFKVFLFKSNLADAASYFVELRGLGAAINNHVLPAPGGGESFVAAVLEGWFDQRAEAVAAVENLPRETGGFAVVAEEYDTARLRAHHGC